MSWITSLLVVVLGGSNALADKPKAALQASTDVRPIIGHLADELAYTMEHLENPDGVKPYYLSYSVYDEQRAIVAASLGALSRSDTTHTRNLNIDLRVGDYQLDNTHQLRGGGSSRAFGSGNIQLPLHDKPDAVAQAVWLGTDRMFKRAVKRLSQIKTNLKVKVEEDDSSDDFSREKSVEYFEEPAKLTIDLRVWAQRLKQISSEARSYPLIYSSSAVLGVYAGTRYMVTNEGVRLQTSQTRYRITLSAGTRAEDGMDLAQSADFNSATVDGLPDAKTLQSAFHHLLEQVLALRRAPLAEPYIGPAILRNRAAGVFFHEIFGHRIEGHRQKDVTEGQTFTKKVGHSVLPSFIGIHDDPTMAQLDGIDLRGHYLFDDEGVRSVRVPLVEAGILRNFVLSRSPLDGFPLSNGHGRRQPGNAVTSRQGNLIVESTQQVSFDRLREMLIEECVKQKKPYGLLFEDISGGFTTTSRRGPQSFKVMPIIVYRIFADGRPDELIRGADIVGTPLTCFERILTTGDDPAVFNGTCGAESGWIPVSAISPSILVSTIEIEKRTRNQSRPPILEPPLGDDDSTG